MEMWKLGLQIGSKLDVKDTVDKWCEATVVAVDREVAKVYVTYTYWAPKVGVFEKPPTERDEKQHVTAGGGHAADPRKISCIVHLGLHLEKRVGFAERVWWTSRRVSAMALLFLLYDILRNHLRSLVHIVGAGTQSRG